MRRNPQAQPGMSAAYYGLIGVIRVNALSLPCYGQSERVAGRGDAIARGPTDTDDQVGMVHWSISPAKKMNNLAADDRRDAGPTGQRDAGPTRTRPKCDLLSTLCRSCCGCHGADEHGRKKQRQRQ